MTNFMCEFASSPKSQANFLQSQDFDDTLGTYHRVDLKFHAMSPSVEIPRKLSFTATGVYLLKIYSAKLH